MPESAHRCVAVTAAATFGLLAAVSSASAAAPKQVVPPLRTQNVIVIPSQDQVSSSLNASRCSWLKAYVVALSVGANSAFSCALLLAAPLVAAEYALNGMGVVSGPDGC
jgi:hypothetical protein